MQAPLLQTKLMPPPLSRGLVARRRVESRLSEALRLPITLIQAPAGFGKTTLLRTAAEAANPCAWVRLDRGDNDPVRFWSYVLTALDAVIPDAGKQPLALLQSLQPPIQTILATCLNAVAASNAPCLLIIDDYHHITHSTIHETLAFWLDVLPPNLRVALIARTEPPLPWARWRVSGRLADVRAHDLRFTPEEARAFFAARGTTSLGDADLGRLIERTEGWAAGLHLAALALSGGSPGVLADTFGGSHRYLADYLFEEVFGQQAPELQAFLLRCAVPTELCAELAAELSGWERDTAQAALERLARDDLFMAPLAGRPGWYRWHAIFQEFLLHQAQRALGGYVADLHHRAARWLGAHEALEAAFGHALAAEDQDLAAELMVRRAQLLWQRGEYETLDRDLGQISEEAIHAHPILSLIRVWMLLSLNRPLAALGYIERIERGLDSGAPRPERMASEVWALRAVIAAMRQQPAEAIAAAERSEAQTPPDEPFAEALALFAQAAAFTVARDFVRAERAYQRSALMAGRAGHPHLVYSALINLANLHQECLRLDDAEQVCRRALALIARDGIEPPSAGFVHWTQARLAYDWNDLAAAEAAIIRARELCDIWDNRSMRIRTLIAYAQIRQAQGCLSDAAALLDEAEELAQGMKENGEIFLQWVVRERIAMALAANDLPDARHWANALSTETETSDLFLQLLMLAKVALAEGRPEAALKLLEQAESQAAPLRFMAGDLVLLLFRARLLAALDATPKALTALLSALQLAAPARIVRPFVDEGAALVPLLEQVATKTSHPAFVGALLGAFGALPAPQPRTEPLTQRELQILRLLASGLSNRAIADHLVIAEGTLKRHISNLYGKLGVHTRTQALGLAQELGLL